MKKIRLKAPLAGILTITGLVFLAIAYTDETTPDPPETSAHPCESESPFHDFDFWIGEWEVRDAAGSLAGYNRIARREKGCVLLEEWTGTNGSTGLSINYYDPGTGKWKQSWVSAGAYLLEIEGGLDEDGAMVLEGRIFYIGPGRDAAFRGKWTPLEDGRVRQYFEESPDGGETWSEWFDGYYTRSTESGEK